MPKLATPLTDLQVKTAKPREKPYTLADGGGMYLEVLPSGAKVWRMAYRQANGKNMRLTFGKYPEISLMDARQKRMDARKQKAAGVDPAQAKRIEKLTRAMVAANTFEALAREWHENKSETWKENTAKEALSRLEKDVFPLIGSRPITEVDAPLMLDVLSQVEKRGALDMAARLSSN
jgi:hypothetical protein